MGIKIFVQYTYNGKKSKTKNRYQYFQTQVAINKVILLPTLFVKKKKQTIGYS